MNIFVVARNPHLAAHMLCDQHIKAMPTAAVRMMFAIYRRYVPHFVGADTDVYKAEDVNHPCTLWAANGTANYAWLVDHTTELFAEHTRRFHKLHEAERMFERVRNTPYAVPDRNVVTPFVQHMPERYRGKDAVEAYRRYYIGEKLKRASWRYGSPPPYWVPESP